MTTENLCPYCKTELRFLAGCPAHDTNRYCPNEACGYEAWNTMTDEPLKPEDAIENLRNHQEQLDHAGTMVGVSRQALDEVLTYLNTRAQPAQEPVAFCVLDAANEVSDLSMSEEDAEEARVYCQISYSSKKPHRVAPLYLSPPTSVARTCTGCGVSLKGQRYCGLCERDAGLQQFLNQRFLILTDDDSDYPDMPEAWHEKPFARIGWQETSGDKSIGYPGHSGFCLDTDQSGTVLGDLVEENKGLERALRIEQELWPCEKCAGTGWIITNRPYDSSMSECSKCRGKGEYHLRGERSEPGTTTPPDSEAVALLAEMDKYLDHGHGTNINTDSGFHRQMKAFLATRGIE